MVWPVQPDQRRTHHAAVLAETSKSTRALSACRAVPRFHIITARENRNGLEKRKSQQPYGSERSLSRGIPSFLPTFTTRDPPRPPPELRRPEASQRHHHQTNPPETPSRNTPTTRQPAPRTRRAVPTLYVDHRSVTQGTARISLEASGAEREATDRLAHHRMHHSVWPACQWRPEIEATRRRCTWIKQRSAAAWRL